MGLANLKKWKATNVKNKNFKIYRYGERTTTGAY
jgi:hypothetical protein